MPNRLRHGAIATKGPRKKNFHILGARIWVGFVRSEGAKMDALRAIIYGVLVCQDAFHAPHAPRE